jgi:hypothetical protein
MVCNSVADDVVETSEASANSLCWGLQVPSALAEISRPNAVFRLDVADRQ